MTVDEPGFGRVLILVPAYNEQDCIAATIAEIGLAVPTAEVLVIDDASTDATASLASAAGARVLGLPVNAGAGAAMRAGYGFAAEADYDVAVRVDADGQHDPIDIPDLLAAVRDGADVAVGSRFSGAPGYPIGYGRRWAIRRLSSRVTLVTGVHLTDATSGFRAVSRRAIPLHARETDPRFLGDTVTPLVSAVAAGLEVVEVPVRMRARQGGRPSLGLVASAVGFWRMCRSLSRQVPLESLVPSAPVAVLRASED